VRLEQRRLLAELQRKGRPVATIVYSLAGEGRGHATRTRTVIEALQREHRIIVLAPGVAHQLLADAYCRSDRVTVHAIPGLQFQYRGKRLDYLRSCCLAVPFLWRMRSWIDRIAGLLREEKPDLAITDFEPLLPRAAERCGVPYLSFDHQHCLLVNDLSHLPWLLRCKAWLLAPSVRLFYRRQRRTIVSSFYQPPLKPHVRHVTQTGTLLRPEILRSRSVPGESVLVYMRRFLHDNLLDALRRCGRPVKIYGLEPRPPQDGIEFCQVDERNFLQDLSRCYAVISNAGNQLVGEAFYLKKPFLALPESGNFEQAINAHFVRESGGGDWISCEKLDASFLRQFLDKVPVYREQICSESVVGNAKALETIRAELAAIQGSTTWSRVPQAA
jgi:uncharacterized protein (TIGR00661 family)